MQVKKNLWVLSLVVIISLVSLAADWKVAGDFTFAPFTFSDDKGNLVGYEIDLSKALGMCQS